MGKKKIQIDQIVIPVMFYVDEETNEKVYDFEGMAEQFENELSQLDDSVLVICSVKDN